MTVIDASPTPSAWAWVLEEYARRRGVRLDAGVLALAGAGVWLGLMRDITPDGHVGVDAIRDSRTFLCGSRWSAFESANALLGGELLVYRRRDRAQFHWIRFRAFRQRPTIVTIAARLVDPACPPGRTTMALVETVEPNLGEGSDVPPPASVVLRLGAEMTLTVTVEAFLDAWSDAGRSCLDAEWFIWVPATPRDAPASWRGFASMALLRQHVLLGSGSAHAPVGPVAMRALRVALASDGRQDAVAAHLALISRSQSSVAELGGPSDARRTALRGVRVLETAGWFDWRETAALGAFAGALEQSADAWDRLTAMRAGVSRSALDAAYAAIERAEASILATSLEAATAIGDAEGAEC